MSEFITATINDERVVLEKKVISGYTAAQVDEELARIEALILQWQQRYQQLLLARSILAKP